MAGPQFADHCRKSGVVGADNPFALSFPGQHNTRQMEGMLEIVRSKDARMCREGRSETGFFNDSRGQRADLAVLPEGIGKIGRFDDPRFEKPTPAAADFRD